MIQQISLIAILSTLIGFLPWSLHYIREIHALVALVPANRNSNDQQRQRLRLVSWNILAPTYSHPQKYPWSSKEHLSWRYRQKLILSDLKKIDADVICLQEMECALFDAFMSQISEEYLGILQNTTDEHPVGNAILVRKNKLKVLRQESRSRALILVVNGVEKFSPARPLYLANVHLQAGMEDDKTRVCQLKSLLKRIHNHVRMEISQEKTGWNETTKQLSPAVIVAGDFNMLATNPVYRWLSHRHQGTGTNKQSEVNILDNGTGLELLDLKFPKKVPLLPLKDIFSDLPPVLQENGEVSEAQGHSEVKMTYCGGSVLDYIWTMDIAVDQSTDISHKSAVEVLQTLVFHTAAFSPDRQQWPSGTHPSDHLPVGVDFYWR